MSHAYDTTQIRLKDLTALKEKADLFLLPDSTKKSMVGVGGAHSPFKSRGLDFQEVRVYQPGDDIRQIDWHVTAKYGKPFTKLYTEEKERCIFFVVDLREQMQFATHGAFKSVIAARMAAFMAFIAEHQKDKIGYIILTDDGLTFSGAADNSTLPTFLSNLVHPKKTDSTADFGKVIRLLHQFLPAGAFVFFFSDFYDWHKEDTTLLAPLAEKNTFLFCFIYDQLETELPQDSLPFSNGKEMVIVSTFDDKIRKKFHDEWAQHVASLEKISHKYDWALLPIATDSDYLDIFTRFCFGRGERT